MSYYRETGNYRQVERYTYGDSGAPQRDYVRTDVQVTKEYGSQAPTLGYGSSSGNYNASGASGWKTYDGTKVYYDSKGDSHTGQCAYRHYLKDGGVKPSKK